MNAPSTKLSAVEKESGFAGTISTWTLYASVWQIL
jgi:hypothetical protein